MEKAVFNTKFASDMDRNGQVVKVLKYLGNDMYLIEFKDKKQLRVYDNELEFEEEE